VDLHKRVVHFEQVFDFLEFLAFLEVLVPVEELTVADGELECGVTFDEVCVHLGVPLGHFAVRADLGETLEDARR